MVGERSLGAAPKKSGPLECRRRPRSDVTERDTGWPEQAEEMGLEGTRGNKDAGGRP